MVFQGSRYARCRKRIRANRPYLTTPTRVNFSEEKCKLYQFMEGDTIDGLAYKFYGNAAYWWCIMDANRVYQSELEIKPGAILQIPAWEEVKKVV